MAAPIAGKKSLSLLSRFKGALVGAVAGDCLGANFEGFWHIIQAEELEKFFRSLDDKDGKFSMPIIAHLAFHASQD